MSMFLSTQTDVRGSLDVVSCGTGPLCQERLDLCLRADHVYGSGKLLALLAAAEAGQGPIRHSLAPSPRAALAEATSLARQGAKVALLASGDALYHGLGGTLARLLEDQRQEGAECSFTVRFHPGVTAYQELCHRLGLPWDTARLFSAHSGRVSLRPMLEAPFAIIYAGLPLTGSKLARALLDLHPASARRSCVLAEQLASPHERLFRGSLEDACRLEAGPTSILMLLPEGYVPMPLPLGLADEELDFDNHCLTAREIRPLVLSALRLPSAGVLWDLGAGSGSVGLEAALLRPALQVEAVEKAPARCRNIEHNITRHGAANVRLHEGDILAVLPRLPVPDRVFIGGGGRALRDILLRSLSSLNPDDPLALVAVTAISLESVAMLSQFQAECPEAALREALSVDIAVRAPMAGGWSRLSHLNRIHLFVFSPRRA